MKPALLYRVSAGLLVLFAAGHQLGFLQVDPSWHAEVVTRAMHVTRFPVQGFTRTYWEFFSGFGFFVTAFLLFSAVLAWELGRVRPDIRQALFRLRWALAICHVVIAALTWRYFFLVPDLLATVIAACLLAAAIRREAA